MAKKIGAQGPAQKKSKSKRLKNIKLLVFLHCLVIFIIALLFPKNRYSEYQYAVNDITHETIIAPFDYPILKSKEELNKDRQEAVRNTPFVFKQDTVHPEQETEKLANFFKLIDRIRAAENKYQDSKELQNKYKYSKRYAEVQSITAKDSLQYQQLIEQLSTDYNFDTSSTVIQTLLRIPTTADFTIPENFTAVLKQILNDIYSYPVLDIPKDQINSQRVAIQYDGEELLEDLDQVLSLEEAWAKAKVSLQNQFPEHGSRVINIGHDIIVHFLKPNLIFQNELTQSRQKEAIDKVPISRGIVLKNEKIVGANTKVTPEIHRKLESLVKERARRTNLRSKIRKSLPLIGDPLIFLGQLAIVAIIYSFFITFMLAYQSRIIKNLKLTILIGIIFILEILLTSLFVDKLSISEYAIPITIAAMMFTILFDTRIAFSGIACLSIIIGVQLGGNIYFIITSIFVSSFAIYSVRKLRKRSQVFQSILYIILGYLIGISITELRQFTAMDQILNHLLYGGINGVLAPFIAYGAIGLIETAFGITTDLTLLELSDFNHPLLKMLTRKATGTFTHSITVGNLAEAAADAVGANSLLARVGSYYHDIGKTAKPEYFVENQAYDSNKHDKLAPNLSALIIINHVKEGLKLAKEHKLPEAIVDFISTHHGTTRVDYFYQKAIDQAKDPEDVNITDFQYPGPKPTTKETGIVMICESIEAATRSLEHPTISNIEKIIDTIIAKRLNEGQLDQCPLTLADLRKIKGDISQNTGILPILKSIHHLRVEYPDQETGKKPSKKPRSQPKKQPNN